MGKFFAEVTALVADGREAEVPTKILRDYELVLKESKMPQSDQCILCAHYLMGKECDAFPDGIPNEIFTGFVDHTHPYQGDHGVQFEPIKHEDSR